MTTVFRLREALEGREPPLALKELERASGVSYTTIHDIYHNKTTRVDLATLDALASVLGCAPGELIGVRQGGIKPGK